MFAKHQPVSKPDASHRADKRSTTANSAVAGAQVEGRAIEASASESATIEDSANRQDDHKLDDETPDTEGHILQHEVIVAGQWAVLAQVAGACDLPRDTLLEAAAKGGVWLQKSVGKRYRKPVRIRTFDQAAENDRILVNYAPAVLAMMPAIPTLVADEKNYSVWDKPSGLLSQGSKWSDHCTITSQVEKIHNKRALLVHRLDRAARGLIVIAHTKNAVVALADLFATRKVEKTYRAVVNGVYEPTLPVVLESPVDGKPAHTEIVQAKQMPETGRTALTVKIKTGRKHQIRSHLAQLGYPVVGDRLFDPNAVHREDLQLVASELQFVCPFSKKHCHYISAADNPGA